MFVFIKKLCSFYRYIFCNSKQNDCKSIFLQLYLYLQGDFKRKFVLSASSKNDSHLTKDNVSVKSVPARLSEVGDNMKQSKLLLTSSNYDKPSCFFVFFLALIGAEIL